MNRLPEAAHELIQKHLSNRDTTMLCMVQDRKTAVKLAEDIRFLWICYQTNNPPIVEVFPPYKVRPGIDSELERLVPAMRNRCQYLHIFAEPKPIIISTLGAFSTRCPSDEIFSRYFLQLSKQDEISVPALRKICIDMGYESQDLVDEVGSFTSRGFVVDIFSPYKDLPVRIEFVGSQIESIKTFNLHTQHTQDELENFVLLSPKFFHYHEHQDLQTIEHQLSKIPIPVNKKYEMIDALRAGMRWEAADLIELSSSPDFVYPNEFFKEAKFYIVDSTRCLANYSTPYDVSIEPEYLPLSRSPFINNFQKDPKEILDTLLPHELKTEKEAATRFMPFTFHKDTRDEFFKNWLPRWIKGKGKVFFSYQSHLHLQRILKHLEQSHIEPSSVNVKSNPLSESFLDQKTNIACVRAQDLFAGAGIIEVADQAKTKFFFSTLKTLSEGDYVIHVKHGIAKYKGLQKITFDKTLGEYISLEFSQEDKLFIPIYRLHLIQKYKGEHVENIQLDSLRDQKFEKRKKKIQEKITRFANEIIEIQAKRELARTESFSRNEEEENFAEGFPYDETQDQVQSIQEVLRDLEKTLPMDRLLCGDVGFGKTEVAFRGIFRVLSHGKQAAILTPTTLLAHQHYYTAKQRFKNYPFNFAVLSRFKTIKEQRKIVTDLKAGKIDCIIGTHRLLQKDIDFSDLGFVVIDEEQKFGVKHKEYLKRIRINTHTLSLSATPIPRTLNQALTGMRSLSIITTPPTNRLPIHTYLSKPDHQALNSVLERELAREGQIFCVVPRIKDIPDIEGWFQQYLPGVPYGIAHGQLPENELENIMIDFYERKYPILISTTIIESGLDVPNANTMFIFKANKFGLAQLYQLRGRIGRSQRQAYCYLLLSQRVDLPKKAKKRLEILLRYNDLGSGFQVANHDLEIRGAGNVLGKEQSGFMHDVGAELYFDMLRETIKKLQGKEEEEVDPEIVWGWESLIPEFYLPSISLRLEIYQNLSKLDDRNELFQQLDELENRFGPPPIELLHLIHLHNVRIFCHHLGVKHLQVRGGRIDLTFIDTPPVDMKDTLKFLEKDKLKYQFKTSHQLSILTEFDQPSAVVTFMDSFAKTVIHS